MNKVKWLIAVVILVIVVALLVLFYVRGRDVDMSQDDLIRMENQNGIHYGGTFNEFEYREESERVEEETESINMDEVASEMDKIKKEYEEKKAQDIIRESKTSDPGNQIQFDGDVGEEEEATENDTEMSESMEKESNGEDLDITESEGNVEIIKSNGYVENEVVCEANSMEEAEVIANQIDGVVLSCEYGIATIQIKENVDVLLERLQQQGSDLILYRNYYISTP